MWESQAYSFVDERRKKIREHKQRRAEWLKSRRFQFKRIGAEIRPLSAWGSKSETSAARIFNIDLQPERAYLFCTTRIVPGQEVECTVLADDGKFYLRGVVESCQRLHLSSAIETSDDFQFRIGVRFKYRSEDEFQQIQERITHFISKHVRPASA
jgi:hypothetical protein